MYKRDGILKWFPIPLKLFKWSEYNLQYQFYDVRHTLSDGSRLWFESWTHMIFHNTGLQGLITIFKAATALVGYWGEERFMVTNLNSTLTMNGGVFSFPSVLWRSLMAWMFLTRARSTRSICVRSAKSWATTAAACNKDLQVCAHCPSSPVPYPRRAPRKSEMCQNVLVNIANAIMALCIKSIKHIYLIYVYNWW